MSQPSRYENPRLVMIGNQDLSGVMRGRSFPVERISDVLKSGLPWVPVNVLISPLNSLPSENPFGPVGETRLKADLSAFVVLPQVGDRPSAIVHLADIETTEGEVWPMCPRGQLKRAIADLESEFGLTMMAGFEHELYIYGLQDEPTPAFSLQGSRAVSALAEDVYATLATGSISLEQFAAEYGAHQFELASPPANVLAAADQAVLAREVIRDAARLRGLRATFIPMPDPASAGSGVHIHFSLWRKDGSPATARHGRLVPEAASFTTGILRHLAKVVGFTTPSVNSFDRFRPSSWVGIYSCFGERNREAAIRFCPRGSDGEGWHRGASLEFRVADATSNPYLALAALIRAGLDGLRDKLAAPVDVDRDPAAMTEAQRSAVGAQQLPASLSDVIARIDADGAAKRWFGELFWSAYRASRLNDIADAEHAGDRYIERLAKAI
ncbi:glutamine synthetase family protein [Mesorhizobium sp.]|uniref:glutamine synthetase family protein n=1 Tax=Mesorhizobium sp. TaxID=1871066 RepID=UPI000FE4D5EF|nr:glutamine synthetase family protein [Mesorhizobium sp.]RWP22879.1 MAG: glutamine synthetase [Mesorhizobium sp.]